MQVSKDSGLTWTEVGKNIPGVNHEYYVSGIEASHFDPATAYVALDGHRNDDLKPYIFKTTDYGQTWTSVSGNLPAVGNVNSIREDPVNRNLLFAPTELGFYVSLNAGRSWSRFMPNLPVGRMDEVLVHPRDHDLILSSHAFSIWIMDDISALEAMTPDMAGDATLFKPRDAVLWKNDLRQRTEVPGEKFWEGENALRGTAISYYLKTAASDVKATITDLATGRGVFSCIGDKMAGLNRFEWALDDRGGSAVAAECGGGGGGGTPAPRRTAPALQRCEWWRWRPRWWWRRRTRWRRRRHRRWRLQRHADRQRQGRRHADVQEWSRTPGSSGSNCGPLNVWRVRSLSGFAPAIVFSLLQREGRSVCRLPWREFEYVDAFRSEQGLERGWCPGQGGPRAPMDRHDLADAQPLRGNRRGIRPHRVEVADR